MYYIKENIMNIGIDLDDVVCDLGNAWILKYNQDYNDNLKKEDILQWDVSKFVKKECGKKVFGYFNDPTLYLNCLEIPNSLNCINILKEQGHNILFISACMPKTMEAKYEWLKKHNYINSINEFIAIYDKSLINVDILLDDKPETIENFPKKGVLFSQPWNQNYNLPRVNDWEEFIKFVKKYNDLLISQNQSLDTFAKWVR